MALAAEGFGIPRPAAVGTRQINLLIQRLGLLQIDSVNVFERSHYLPVFARLGSYDKTLLDKLTFARRGPYTEYLAHVATFIPTADYPLFGFRRDRLRVVNEAADVPPRDIALHHYAAQSVLAAYHRMFNDIASADSFRNTPLPLIPLVPN